MDIEELTLPQTEEDYITIDEATRTITVPDKYKLFGVTSDNNANRLYFKCKKLVNDVDLSTMHLYVNYHNANNIFDAYAVDDVTVNGDYITFSWLLGPNATSVKGDVNFIVCAKKSAKDGTITNEWNTTIASGTVLDGIEATNQVVTTNPDILEQILTKLDNVQKGAVDEEVIAEAVNDYFVEHPQAKKLSDLEDDATHRLVTDAQINTWTNKSDFDGDYTKLKNKPTIPTKLADLTTDTTHQAVSTTEKQTWNGKLASADLKTLNGQTLVGAGDIAIQGGGGDKYTIAAELILDDTAQGVHTISYDLTKLPIDRKGKLWIDIKFTGDTSVDDAVYNTMANSIFQISMFDNAIFYWRGLGMIKAYNAIYASFIIEYDMDSDYAYAKGVFGLSGLLQRYTETTNLRFKILKDYNLKMTSLKIQCVQTDDEQYLLQALASINTKIYKL